MNEETYDQLACNYDSYAMVMWSPFVTFTVDFWQAKSMQKLAESHNYNHVQFT